MKENKMEKLINDNIKQQDINQIIDTNNISDGQHTFGELYEHRAKLFSVICNQESNSQRAWKSRLHEDGSMFTGYFIVGIETPEGQATYHYEMRYWDLFNVKELEKAPKWDGHTPEQAIDRILSLNTKNNKIKKLEEEIIEKDKGMEYLNGRIDGMEYIIDHLNLKVEDR